MGSEALPQAHHIERTTDGCLIAYDEKLPTAAYDQLGRHLGQLEGVDRVCVRSQSILVACRPYYNQNQILRRVDELVMARYAAANVVSSTRARHGFWFLRLRLHIPINPYWAMYQLYPHGQVVRFNLNEDGIEGLETIHQATCAQEAIAQITQEVGVWPMETAP